MRSMIEQARERKRNLHRHRSRLCDPRRVMLGAAVLSVLIGVSVAIWQRAPLRAALDAILRQTHDWVAAKSAEAGLTIDHVVISGRARTDADALRTALDAPIGDPILFYDIDGARTRIERLSWVRNARIARRLPNRLLIEITERTPLALWQDGARHVMIDGDGVALQDHDLSAFDALPVVVGADAPEHARDLIGSLDAHPDLRALIRGAQRVGGRRWNLMLGNGILVRLPETALDAAWRRLNWLIEEQNLLEREVLTVDLRRTDRTYIRLSPHAAERHRAPPAQPDEEV